MRNLKIFFFSLIFVLISVSAFALPFVPAPGGVWTDITSEMSVGENYNISPTGKGSFYVSKGDNAPDFASNSTFIVSGDEFIGVAFDGTAIWCRPTTSSKIDIHIQEIAVGGGVPTDEFGNVEVVLQDQHTEIVDLYLSRELDVITLLNNYNIDDQDGIEIETTGTVPLVNDIVCFKEGVAFYQGRMLAVNSLGGNQYSLDLDTPLDFAFTTAGGCSTRNTNMAVDGSVTPVEFNLSPGRLDPTLKWDIIRISVYFTGNGFGTPPDDQPDDTGFGASGPVVKGIVIRTVDGVTKNIFNANTNARLRIRTGGDLLYIDKNKDGLYATHFRRTFNGQDKNGVTLRLNNAVDPADADRVVVIIQDDLSPTSVVSPHENIEGVVQGHVVGP